MYYQGASHQLRFTPIACERTSFIPLPVEHVDMALDVEVPDPPDLTNRGIPNEFQTIEEVGTAEDYRPEELEAVLAEGAWEEGFREWREYTDLSEREYRIASDLGLVQSIDIFWNPNTERLDYSIPQVPDKWREQSVERDVTASTIENALDDLGDVIVEMIEDGYLDWGTEGADYEIWTEDRFGSTGEPET